LYGLAVIIYDANIAGNNSHKATFYPIELELLGEHDRLAPSDKSFVELIAWLNNIQYT
jgi:hypothetical protein